MFALIEKFTRYKWIFIGSIILSACASASAIDNPTQTAQEPDDSGGTSREVVQPSAFPEAAQPSEEPQSAQATGIPDATPTFPPDESPPSGATSQFSTDFSKHSIPYNEILSGGPPKDGIPAIDNPQFVRVEEADEWLEPQEPVILFEINDDVHAYPLQILTWHEIANDVVGGEPVVVTFCPLCNTAIVFERTFNGQVLDFGTTGRLRFSNLIMYDRQTETWWQQASGEAIAGEMTGEQLEFLPATIIGWEEFKNEHPDGRVLSRETGYSRPYGRNPYTGYDDINSSPFLYKGPQTPGTLPPMARVLTVDTGQQAIAYPYTVLQEVHVVNDTIGEDREIVVIWETGTASALDAGTVAGGKDVGTTAASVNHFWFSWAAFKPETRVYQPQS
jgi:hypothetical protein